MCALNLHRPHLMRVVLILLWAAICSPIRAEYLLPCGTVNLSHLVASDFVAENCTLLALLGVPTTDVSINVTNSTVTQFSFLNGTVDVGDSFANISITFMNCTIFGSVRMRFESFLTNVTVAVIRSTIQLTPGAKGTFQAERTVFVYGTGQCLSTIRGLRVIIHHSNIKVVFGRFGALVAADGVAFGCSVTNDQTVFSADSISVDLQQSNLSLQCADCTSQDQFQPELAIATVVSVSGDAALAKQAHFSQLQVNISECDVTINATRSADMVLTKDIAGGSGILVKVLDCECNFTLLGTGNEDLPGRNAHVLTLGDSIHDMDVNLTRVKLFVETATGTTFRTENASHARYADAFLVNVIVQQDGNFVRVVVEDCAVWCVVPPSMFTSFTGKVNAAAVQLLTATSAAVGSVELIILVKRCRVEQIFKSSFCPYERTIIWRTLGEQPKVQRAVRLSGIGISIGACIVSLLTPISNAVVEVTRCSVNVSFENDTVCPPVSAEAWMALYDTNGAVTMNLTSRCEVNIYFVVCTVIIMEIGTITTDGLKSIISNPFIFTALSTGITEAPQFVVNSSFVMTATNISVKGKQGMGEAGHLSNIIGSARSIMLGLAVDMKSCNVTIVGPIPSSTPFFTFSKASVTSSNLEGINLTATGLAPAPPANFSASYEVLDWVTLSESNISNSNISLIRGGPWSMVQVYSGSLLSLDRCHVGPLARITFSRLFFVDVAPSVLVMNASNGNVWTDDRSSTVTLSCVTWNGVLLNRAEGLQLLDGAPQSMVRVVELPESGCFHPTALTKVHATLRGAAVTSALIASSIVGGLALGGGGGSPVGLVSSLGIVFPDGCDAITFSGIADGNYLSLSVGDDDKTWVRGTLIGACVVLACLMGICFLAAMVACRCGRATTFRTALVLLAFPGCLYGTVPWLLMPTVAAVAALGSPSFHYVDVVGMTIGSTLVAITAAMVVDKVAVHFTGRCVPSPHRRPSALEKQFPMLKTATDWLLRVDTVWKDAVAGSHFVQCFGQLFEPFRPGRQWFAIADLSMTAAMGIVLGLAFGADDASCRKLGIVFGSVELLYALISLVLSPTKSLKDKLVGAILSFLALIHGLLVVILIPSGACEESCPNTAGTVATTQLYVSAIFLVAEGMLRLTYRHDDFFRKYCDGFSSSSKMKPPKFRPVSSGVKSKVRVPNDDGNTTTLSASTQHEALVKLVRLICQRASQDQGSSRR